MPSSHPGSPNPKCTATAKNTGKRCGHYAIDGGTVCLYHGGGAPQVRNRAAILAAVSRWAPGMTVADPAELLYRLMTVAEDRANQHGEALNAILETEGWTSAFVGDAYTESGQKTGEYARQLAKWEFEERKLATDLAVKAIAANLEARRVRATEAQVAIVLEAVRVSLAEHGLEERAGEVIGGIGRHLHAVAS